MELKNRIQREYSVDFPRRGKMGGSGQSSLWVKWVMGQNGSFLNGSIGLQVNWLWVGSGLPVFFKLFFFQLQKQINDNLFRENE